MNKHRLSQHIRIIMLIAFGALFAGAALAQESVCTLADHIRSANTNTAVGLCPAGTSHDIITIAEDITLTEPLPPITGTITIEGGGHTISGDNQFRIFDVDGGRLTINSLTMTDGRSTESGGRAGPGGGGAIKVRNRARLVVNDSHFSENSSAGYGGAIFVSGRSHLTVHQSSFSNNRAVGDGGAIAFWYGTGDISRSSFIRNGTRRQQIGGAIFVGIGVDLNVTDSTFNGNSAGQGGAVGSEVWTPGGIVPSKTTLTHVTMNYNEASMGGHSLWIDDDDKNFKLRNSIVAGLIIGNCDGPLNENVGNLIADGSCGSMKGGDVMFAGKSGSRHLYELSDGSPALDAADARFCTETDQIGTPRPQGGGCDIGAFESMTAVPAPTAVPAVCPLPDQIIAANTDTAVGNCPAGSGADIIYMIRDFTLSEKLPPITSEIVIEGNGYTISGDNNFGIFDVDGGALTIRNVTLTEGNASRGGAILLRNGGRAIVENVNFRLNTAFFGGAIATNGDNTWLDVSKSSFERNNANTTGGAIMTEGGGVSVRESAFIDNLAQQYGGAIATASGRAAISNSTLIRNKAEKGGGIYANGGATTLTHLTLMNNQAARIIGAGIYREAGAVHLRNSIVAGSGSGDDCSGGLDQNLGNFSQDGSCSTRAGGEPLLAELIESPAHYPLLDSSPAHGAGDPAFCPPTDQLGNPRPHCDIGAIESARDPNYALAAQAGVPAGCTLADQIIAANTDEPVGSCPAGDGADTITLGQSITLREPQPPIKGDLTINGNGHTIDGDNRFPIFDIERGAVTIKNLNLYNGNNSSEQPEGFGGAITLRNSARLTVVNVGFRNNSARYGGAIAALDISILKVFESRFFANRAAVKGGAVWGSGSCTDINNNSFRRNTAGMPTRTFSGTETTMHVDGRSSLCSGREFNYFSDT